MISLEKWLILKSLQKLTKNVGDLGKFISVNGFKKLPKVQKIAKSGLTDQERKFNYGLAIFITLAMYVQVTWSKWRWVGGWYI